MYIKLFIIVSIKPSLFALELSSITTSEIQHGKAFINSCSKIIELTTMPMKVISIGIYSLYFPFINKMIFREILHKLTISRL